LAKCRPDLDGGARQVEARQAAGRGFKPIDLALQLLAEPLPDAQAQVPGAIGDGRELDLLLLVKVRGDFIDARR
jgi:hypothetical protein